MPAVPIMFERVTYYRPISWAHIVPMVQAAAIPYTGPGDIVSGALGWWGLRAYSSASIGQNVVRLRESQGNTESDFATIAGGGLPISAIDSFRTTSGAFPAATLSITKLYDQSGNGRDVAMGTAGNQPGFTTTVLAGSLSVIDCTVTTTAELNNNATWTTQAQPIAVSSVFRDALATDNCIGSFSNTGNPRWPRNTTSTTMVVGYDGADMNKTLATDTWYRANVTHDNPATTGSTAFYNGSTVLSGVDGGNTGITSGSQNVLLLTSFFTVSMQGYATEFGIWPVGFTAGNLTAMDSNQSTYWGV